MSSGPSQTTSEHSLINPSKPHLDPSKPKDSSNGHIHASLPSPVSIRAYQNELDLPEIIAMIASDLSEPYSVYVYRYFIHQWPHLCFLASLPPSSPSTSPSSPSPSSSSSGPIGTIVCKLEDHRGLKRGYIAMLAVKTTHRGHGIATSLVEAAIARMIHDGADEICLETEVTNRGAMKLYENLGFLRSKRLFRYYLNANDAFRYKLPLR